MSNGKSPKETPPGNSLATLAWVSQALDRSPIEEWAAGNYLRQDLKNTAILPTLENMAMLPVFQTGLPFLQPIDWDRAHVSRLPPGLKDMTAYLEIDSRIPFRRSCESLSL